MKFLFRLLANTKYLFSWRCIAASLFIFWGQLASADLPETSYDGLRRVPSKEVQALYVKPGATLASYTQVAMFECLVAFRKHWQSDQNAAYPKVTAKDMDKMKQVLSDEFRKVFTQELQKGGYSVTNTAGENVLILRPAIIDLDIVAPDNMGAGRNYTFATSAGSMTLFLELYDGATGEILARVVDPRQAREDARLKWQNSVTNLVEADYLLQRWASLLRSALDRARTQPKAAS
jgi:hypothetical protein